MCRLTSNMAPDVIYRVSFFAKLLIINQNGVESLCIAEKHHLLREVNVDINGAEDVPRLTVCKLYLAAMDYQACTHQQGS